MAKSSELAARLALLRARYKRETAQNRADVTELRARLAQAVDAQNGERPLSSAAAVAISGLSTAAAAAISVLTTLEAVLRRDIAALEADKSAEVARRAKATEETKKAAAAVMASAEAEADALVVAGNTAVEEARAKVDKDRVMLEDEKKKIAILVKSSEVISLNVGGTSLAVLRSTLTSVEGSMLAGMFSGRWEKSLVKDKHGDVFVSLRLRCGGGPIFQLITNTASRAARHGRRPLLRHHGPPSPQDARAGSDLQLGPGQARAQPPVRGHVRLPRPAQCLWQPVRRRVRVQGGRLAI
jgi:hypothetical protein